LEITEYHFYGALSHAALYDAASPDWKQVHFESLITHHKQLEVWAENCPENFENRAALAAAEIARIEGRVIDAEHLYEEAIRSAHENGFVHNEAVACEMATRFYAARGFERIARTYLRSAIDCYQRWGADGKIRQLDKLYPHLKEKEPRHGATSTISAPVDQLDLATVIKVSQAVSGEIVLEKLIDTLMRTAIEHAGAERGLLIFEEGDEYRIETEVRASADTVSMGLPHASVTGAQLPESVLRYVVRTKESVLLHDASGDNPFSADEYIHRHQARSILCLPLLKQIRLIAVLYLENNLTPGVFTPARLAVLKVLASQAAISLENVRLYGDLQEREARVRRLVDSNIIGIFIWDLDGRIIDTNEAFQRVVGYSREELISGRMSWRELTPAEWRDADDRWVERLKASGTAPPYEKEYFKKDGARVPVLVGAANFEKDGDAGVAFVIDLTERKQAERTARDTERRFREVQTELAHANRVATMGQLSTSIAHEINQPIAATVTNAQAALRFLAAQPPDIEEVRQALDRIVRNGNRAGDVIDRIRALVKKAPPRKDGLEINEAIREVIALTHGETVKNRVSVQTQLSEELPLVQGDRVQLQQVILNLMINAVEAMSSIAEDARELLISTANAGSHDVLIAVRDSGPGLGLASPDRLFEAFYTTKSDGLGIGLSICRSIIDAHGGRLWASTSIPQGAIFQFTLPVLSDTAS
jgi:PAS domain S-box-containing protein